MDVAKKIKKAYSEDKKFFIAMAIIAIVGIVLRLSFINATDISGDEVFFVTYAYKIASLLGNAPVITLALAAIAIVSAYLIVVKRSLKATILIACILLAAKFGLGIPYLTKASPPFFVLLTTGAILLTDLTPNIAGELVSTIAMVGLAFVGFFWASKWNKKAGILAFALLMFSPYNVFMSTTSFLGPLGWFLAFASLALFFEGQKNPKLLPVAGVLAVLAFATRFPTLIILPFFVGIALLNRKRLLKKENRKNVAIFFVLVFAALVFFMPLVFLQFDCAYEWNTERWDLTEAHMSSFAAEASAPDILPSQDRLFLAKVMNLFYSPLFMILLAMALPLAAYESLKKKNLELATLLLIGIGTFIFFSCIMTLQRTNRALGYEFPAIMLVTFMLASVKKFPRARQVVSILLVLVFLVGSINIVLVNDFKGISGFVNSVPEEAIIYTKGGYFTTSYYKGLYKYDLSINKPFFDKIFNPDPAVEALLQEKRKLVVTELSELEKADFAIIRSDQLDEEHLELLQEFKRCGRIENGNFDMFVVFARKTCP